MPGVEGFKSRATLGLGSDDERLKGAPLASCGFSKRIESWTIFVG